MPQAKRKTTKSLFRKNSIWIRTLSRAKRKKLINAAALLYQEEYPAKKFTNKRARKTFQYFTNSELKTYVSLRNPTKYNEIFG